MPTDLPKRPCAAIRTDGTPCRKPAILGGTVCSTHGGSAPQVRQRAAVRDAAATWVLGVADIDPNETLLRLIAGTSALYRQVTTDLQAAYDAAAAGSEWAGYSPGVRALIGPTYASAANGDRVETGEAVRGLALLQGQLADRLARFCKLAIDAGLSERMVRIAEQQAEIVETVLRDALTEAGLGERATEVLGIAGRHLRAIAG